MFDSLTKTSLNGLLIGHIHLHWKCHAVRGVDFLGEYLQLFRVTRRDDDACPGARERQRDRPPDPLRRAGHQRYAILQAEHMRNWRRIQEASASAASPRI